MENGVDEELLNLRLLREAFPQLSLEAIAAAYTEANGSADDAADSLQRQTVELEANANGNGSAATNAQQRQIVGLEANANGNGNGVNNARQRQIVGLEANSCGAGTNTTSLQPSRKYHALLQEVSCNGSHSAADEENNNVEMPTEISFASKTATSHPRPKVPPKKWITVSSGTVSSVRRRGANSEDHIGNVVSMTDKRRKKKQNRTKANGSADHGQGSPKQREALEQFLFSMLGDEIDLGMDVVSDVIHECQGDPQKSLDSLLHIVSKEIKLGMEAVEDEEQDPQLLVLLEAFPDRDVVKLYKENGRDIELTTNKLLEPAEQNHGTKGKESSYQVLFNQVLDQEYSSTQHILKRLSSSFPNVEPSTLLEVLRASNFDYSDAMKCLIEGGIDPKSAQAEDAANLPEKLLQSLFKASEIADPPKPDEPTATSASEDWKIVTVKPKVKKRSPKVGEKINPASYGEWDDYERHSRSAIELWSTMKHYFHEAAVAYQKGERARAAVLSNKGEEFKQLAREARARASERIFYMKNKDYENNITIDLHDQHVDEAMRLLKVHLTALRSIASVQSLTVITGHGIHTQNGKAKLKPAIISYMKRKGIVWVELNPGCFQINLHSVNLEAQDGSSHGITVD